MPQPYNLFGIGQQSKSPNITAAHRLNCYYDVQAEADKTQVAAYGTPGLVLFSTPSVNITRGMHWFEAANAMYIVQGNSLIAVAFDGSYLVAATLNGPDLVGRVSMANNGTQLCIVTGTYAYIYNAVTKVLTDITATIPYSGNVADTVTFLDGYFIVNRPATGQFFISSVYDGLTWNALNYATAESNPDNLQAVVANQGTLILLGTSSLEIWTNSGNALFPFTRVQAAPSDGGLSARWSLAKCKGQITGLFRNRAGALSVCVLNGYTLTPISTPDIDYLFNAYASPGDAVGLSYTLNGRTFYQITFQQQQASWLYDFQSGAWSQLKSWLIPRHIGDLGASFDTKYIVSDYASGKLYTLSTDALTDNGSPIEREITGSHVFSQARNMATIRRLRVDLEGGVGLVSGQGNTPTIMLQISRDGGHTWGVGLWTSMGKLGSYKSRAEWRRLGQSRDWVFKLRVTDPVKFVIIAAIIEGKELGA